MRKQGGCGPLCGCWSGQSFSKRSTKVILSLDLTSTNRMNRCYFTMIICYIFTQVFHWVNNHFYFKACLLSNQTPLGVNSSASLAVDRTLVILKIRAGNSDNCKNCKHFDFLRFLT
ncbi:hypothetical protein AMECASPLE_018955 [Ameca splendens]|uniref:Uncharacterized protein n=1 Tax=Ameca splendens TaxID=208324 RepID=A0ABV0YPT6_9TELE